MPHNQQWHSGLAKRPAFLGMQDVSVIQLTSATAKTLPLNTKAASIAARPNIAFTCLN